MLNTAPETTAPAAPIILVTTAHPSLHQHPGRDGELVHPRLGRLLQPRHLSSVELTAEAGIPWACDNDCFQGLDERAFVRMLDRVEGLPGCLFVTVPDVVGDAAATLASFDVWAPELERRGLPLGLVAQDGMTVDELEERAPRLAALFIGGSTEWKEGDEAAELARVAKRCGLWVHWGRVNTRRRFDLIVATGAADSFDGSKWARFRKTYLDGGLEWLDEAAAARRAALEGTVTRERGADTGAAPATAFAQLTFDLTCPASDTAPSNVTVSAETLTTSRHPNRKDRSTMHDHWTVAVYGGAATQLTRYRFDDEPEHREVEALLERHGATTAQVTPPAKADDVAERLAARDLGVEVSA